MSKLEGKTAVVTGATSRMGLPAARLLEFLSRAGPFD